MKPGSKFLSVKQAASLLGVSTNTIYSYLKEGKLGSRRIGSGRIRIPFSQVAPFMAQAVVDADAEQANKKSQDANSSQDVFVFRAFKGFCFLGLSIIYFFIGREVFGLEKIFSYEIAVLLQVIIPLSFAAMGAANLFDIFYPKKFPSLHLYLDILSVAALAIFSIFSIQAKQHETFVFLFAFSAVALGHLMRGNSPSKSFRETSTKFGFFVAVIAGIVITFNVELLPVPESLIGLIQSYLPIFALFWIAVFVAPLFYFASPFGRYSRALPYFMLFCALVSSVFAINLTLLASWDAAYFAFISTFFLFFSSWRFGEGASFAQLKKTPIVLSLGWASLALVLGLFVMAQVQDRAKGEAISDMQSRAERLSFLVSQSIDKIDSVTLSHVARGQTRQIISEGDTEAATLHAKEIYEALDNPQRVMIYSSEGQVIGVYPRNTMILGTNFSEREYFVRTKEAYRPYLSGVFQNVLGGYSMVHTQPVFNENEFFGMVASSISLVGKSVELQNMLGGNYEFFVLDKDGKYVLSHDTSEIGFISEAVKESTLVVSQPVAGQDWVVYVTSPESLAALTVSSTHIYLSLFLMGNLVVALSAGVYLALGRKNTPEHGAGVKLVQI